jgi:hypothetical protein
MMPGSRHPFVALTLAACAALFSAGLAQAATVVAGASATVIAQVVSDPVIVLSLSSSAAPNSLTLTATNVSASVAAPAAGGESSAALSIQGADSHPGAGKALDAAPAGANLAAPAASAGNLVQAARKLSVDVTQSELASLGAVSIILNYN